MASTHKQATNNANPTQSARIQPTLKPRVRLEVMSGLNQGEELTLDNSTITIGGSEDCDLYLAEPNLHHPCVIIKANRNNIVVSHIKTSNVHAYIHRKPFKKRIKEQETLDIGETFSLGGVKIEVCEAKRIGISATNKATSTTASNTLSSRAASPSATAITRAKATLKASKAQSGQVETSKAQTSKAPQNKPLDPQFEFVSPQTAIQKQNQLKENTVVNKHNTSANRKSIENKSVENKPVGSKHVDNKPAQIILNKRPTNTAHVSSALSSNQRVNKSDTLAKSTSPRTGKDRDSSTSIPAWLWLRAGSLLVPSLMVCGLTVSVAQGINDPEQANDLSKLSTESDGYSSSVFAEAQQADGQHASTIADNLSLTQASPLTLQRPQQLSQQQPRQDQSISLEEQLPFLKMVFKQMLVDRELPQTVELTYKNEQLIVQGTLSENKNDILERMINRFKSEQKLSDAIDNQVKSSVSSLPFDIVQVTSGRYGNIVTNNGNRLFVGDQLKGYQLIAIQDHQLVFTGKSRVTVSW